MWIIRKIKKKKSKLDIKIKKIRIWFVRKNYIFKNSNHSKRLILFLFPADTDSISGGILSIYSILKEIKKIDKIHQCNVYSSFLPKIVSTNYTYSKFENDLIIFDFNQITTQFKKLDYLEIQIPDIFISMFNIENTDFEPFFDWIKNIQEIKINILNQNDMLMPDLKYINEIKKITPNITMTVAHEKYATIERRKYYDIPLQLFSPWTSPTPYIFKKFNEKRNIIIVSPDIIDVNLYPTLLTKDNIISKLKAELPHFEIITIQNMAYMDYKKLISDAKFAITFGEGLDGYYCEPIFSGCVSFAVYNEVFFTPQFKSLPTVYESFEMLLSKIVYDLKNLDTETNFTNYNNIQNEMISKIYSLERLQDNIKSYYLGELNFN